MTAGTRIFPRGPIHHSFSAFLCKRETSIAFSLNVNDALRHPDALIVVPHQEAGAGGPFDFNGGLVFIRVDCSAPSLCPRRGSVDADLKTRNQHPARRHLVDTRVKPAYHHQLIIGTFTGHLYRFTSGNALRFGDDRRQRDRRLLEGLFFGAANTPHAHIGFVREKFPPAAGHPLHSETITRSCARRQFSGGYERCPRHSRGNSTTTKEGCYREVFARKASRPPLGIAPGVS